MTSPATEPAEDDIIPLPPLDRADPEDELTDEELDALDDAAWADFVDPRPIRIVDDACFAEEKAKRDARRSRSMALLKADREGDKVGLAGLFGASSSNQATWFPKPANDNQLRGRVVFMGEPGVYKPAPELVRDTIPRTGVGFFGGQSGAWKTFFALHASTCLMTGEPLAGRDIERIGGVVYLAAEGAGTIEGRLAARRSRLSDPKEVLPFYRLDGLGAIADPSGYAALEKRCVEAGASCRERFDLPLVALIIDTVAAAGMIAEDKENDPGAWQKVFDALQAISVRLDIVIILIHHAGKNAQAGLRGSSNARAGADFSLMLSCDRDEITGKSSGNFLSLSKSRDAPEGPIASIRAEAVVIGHRDDGSPVTSLTLDFGLGEVAAPKAKKPTRAEHDFLAALGRTEMEPVRVRGESAAPMVQAADLAEVRKEFDAVYVTGVADPVKAKDAKRVQFRRGLLAAQKRGVLFNGTWAETEWVWLSDPDSPGLNRTQSK